MSRRRILWQLYPFYLFIIVVSLAAASWYASNNFRRFFLQKTKSDLEAVALLVEKQVVRCIDSEDECNLNDLCRELGSKAGGRITVVLPDGRVLCDSHEDPQQMENHADRPEFIRALAGRVGESVRYSDTMRKNFMYVAVPLQGDGGIIGAVRSSVPTTFIDDSLRDMNIRIFLGGLVLVVVASLISLLVSRRISRPLERMKQGVERFAQDDLGYRLPSHDIDEIDALAQVMNDMAAKLEDRIQTVLRQTHEQEAVFSSMVEGLLAVDADERIIKMNRAASEFFEVDAMESAGRTIQEVVRNPDLQRFVTRALSSRGPVEGDITLRVNGGERYLQAHGALILDAGGGRCGVVIVLNDVTRLRRLENMRRDFVANVSHELRTPITSIKGFVETLKDGAIRQREDAEHFLGIIAKQTDRMNSIVSDLLTLSRVEQDVEKERVRFETGRIRDVLVEVVQICEPKAADKDIELALDCPSDLTARFNAALIEQAVVNLVDNAVKNSDAGTAVTVEAEAKDGGVLIRVIDRGYGISKEHLPRLFERFYRIDKSRSSKLGGTGLGLSIVKHIAQAHGGSVSVESTPGEGSVFSLFLPDEV